MIDSTAAKIGRSMKKRANRMLLGLRLIASFVSASSRASIATRSGATTTPGWTRCRPLTTTFSPGCSPCCTMRRPSVSRPTFTGRYVDLVLRVDDVHELLALIGADRAVIDQHGAIRVVAEQLDAREQAGREVAVLVVEGGARADRAGARIDLVVDEHHRAAMRIVVLVRQAHQHRVRGIARARALAAARQLVCT